MKNVRPFALASAALVLSSGYFGIEAQLPPEVPPPAPASPEREAPAREQAFQVRQRQTLKGYQSVVDVLTFSPDGTKLVSGGGKDEPFLKVWSVATGKELQKIRAQQTGIKAVVISPDGKVLATSGEDADVHIWNWEGLDDKLIYFEQELNVLSLAIAPDSSLLISGALDGIWLWTLKPRRPFYQLLGYGLPVYALAIAPNGYILASGHEDGTVRFWNLREGAIAAQFRPHTKSISGLGFTPDGKKLVTAGQDRLLKIWDLETGSLLHEMSGHTQIIRSLALSPDGKIAASASNDGIRLWSTSSGRLLAKPYRPNPDWVQSLAFSPDGRLLASGNFDGTIDLWDISPASEPMPSNLTSDQPPADF